MPKDYLHCEQMYPMLTFLFNEMIQFTPKNKHLNRLQYNGKTICPDSKTNFNNKSIVT